MESRALHTNISIYLANTIALPVILSLVAIGISSVTFPGTRTLGNKSSWQKQSRVNLQVGQAVAIGQDRQ